MSALASKSFSRLWRGRSRSETRPQPVDFAGDAAPPFAELASGLESVPTSEELERIRYYHSRMTVRDADFVVRNILRLLRAHNEILADLDVVLGYGLEKPKKTPNMRRETIPYRFHFRAERDVRAFRLAVRQLPYGASYHLINRLSNSAYYSAVVITQIEGTGSDIAFQVYKRVSRAQPTKPLPEQY